MKLKKLIKEWGVGGVVSIKPIGNPFKKQNGKLNEGPAYEYAKEVKNIEKLKAVHDKELEKLIKKIAKQDKKAATEVGRVYNDVNRKYDNSFIQNLEDILSKLG